MNGRRNIKSNTHSKLSSTNHNSSRRKPPRKTQQPSINSMWLRDFLSEMLVVELGGVKLYEKALRDLRNEQHEKTLTEFLQQTERHVELCTDLLSAAGGQANYRSPGAQAADHKANGLLSTEVPDELLDLNNVENLVLAETKDHWNWNTLAAAVSGITDKDLKRLASKAVREVQRQEQKHLDWNEKTLSAIAMDAATKTEADDPDESDQDMADEQ